MAMANYDEGPSMGEYEESLMDPPDLENDEEEERD